MINLSNIKPVKNEKSADSRVQMNFLYINTSEIKQNVVAETQLALNKLNLADKKLLTMRQSS